MVGPWLSGEKVYLRPPRDSDLQRRVEWLNDPETFRLFTGSLPSRPYEYADAQRWLQNLETDATAFLWSIETADHRHIGDVDLHDIDFKIGVARLTILIGDKEFWGKGYGRDAVRTVLRYAFLELGLESVSLRVYDFNNRAIRCYEKCGFEKVGTSDKYSPLMEPGQIYMTATRERFFAENPDVSFVRT
jgi:RimJ/RimL family protein N-acetyltransferase